MSVIDRLRYDGKRALVVGGATGMGAAAAKSAGELGAEVIVMDHAPVNYDVAQAIKVDPGFVEAWFNFAALLRDEGKIDAARTHLNRAITIDPDYADAIYNLASLEFDAGHLDAARAAWSRYLELDANSEWARTATRGIAYIDLNTRKSAG